jgi:hypothetical protein
MREYPGQYLFILAKWQKVLVGCQVVRSVTREGRGTGRSRKFRMKRASRGAGALATLADSVEHAVAFAEQVWPDVVIADLRERRAFRTCGQGAM